VGGADVVEREAVGDGDETPSGDEGRSHVRADGVGNGLVPAAGQVLRAVPGPLRTELRRCPLMAGQGDSSACRGR
jgi:hypothetical protein